jgi:hypothetical protein
MELGSGYVKARRDGKDIYTSRPVTQAELDEIKYLFELLNEKVIRL